MVDSCNHEEADTSVFLHAKQAAQTGHIGTMSLKDSRHRCCCHCYFTLPFIANGRFMDLIWCWQVGAVVTNTHAPAKSGASHM
jgi:hypothetical protein